MKKLTLIITLLFSFTLGLTAQNEPITKANYKLAARYSPSKLNKMVFSTRVSPHWLKESDRFWYEYETSEGKKHYIVDPGRRTKELLFDPVKMAADISRLTRDPFDAKHLPIKDMKFINNETALRFSIQSKYQEEEDTDDEVGKTQQENQEEQEKAKKKPKKMKPTVWWFEYDLDTQELRLLEDYEKPKDNPRWANISPDGEIILFAKNHNLYWMDKENYEKAKVDEKDSTIVENQWTEDGLEFFGYESNNRGSGETEVDKIKNKDKRKRVSVAWSPDSRRFAMIKSDYREVKELFVINSVAEPRPTLEKYKYHMPGEKEAPQYELHIFDVEDKEQKIIEVDTFKDQTLSLFYAPRLKSDRDNDYNPAIWLADNNNEVYFKRVSRDQKRIDICKANYETGEMEVLIEERQEPYVENRGIPFRLVNGGSELLHWSERDGWGHFYLFDGEGNMKNQITSGPYHCAGIEGVDEANKVLYFWANGKEEGEDPYYYHLYRINFDGSGMKLLNPGNYDHAPNMNDKATYFVNNYSRVNTVPATTLHDRQGNKLMDLETADLSKLFESGYQFPEPYKVKADDGITDIYGVMYKPFDFDSTKSYPVIAYVYPGPQTEAVNKSFSARMDRTDRLAQFGFIVVTMGNRGGHPARSRWYHSYGYGNLRDYGLADKKTAIEQLSDRHDFIDIDKVGIFGHSGGGFMSTAAMLVYPDFFKVAVSSSGNHENNIYNRWWSEIHHGVKEVTDDKGNVTFKYDIAKNSELAHNLKGKLMITTGDIDNNVHPGLTIRMANALIKANKRFDFFLFPGQRHGYGNMNEYFFWLRGDYFCKHLIGDFSNSTDIVPMNDDKPRTGRRRP